MHSNKIVIGCDDAGLEFKNILKGFLAGKGYVIEDVGIFTLDVKEMYPNIAAKVARMVQAAKGEKRGILICGTGIGMAMTANKFAGIRAAVVHDVFSAERAALSNDANIIAMGARVIGSELGKKLAMEWLGLNFMPGSSSEKINAITAIEKDNFK